MGKSLFFVLLALSIILVSSLASADMLEITDVIVKVDGDKQTANENGGTIDVTPDSKLSLKIEITNNFPTGTDGGDIDDIEVEVIIEDIDDGDSLEETSSEFDLRPERDKTLSMDFDIPLRLITDENYKMTIDVEGEDKNGTIHTDSLEFDVRVDKEKHELRFLRKEISPSKVSCTRSTTLFVEIINVGEEDEDVELLIDSSDFEYSKRESFEMFEDIDDDENVFEFSDTIDVGNVAPGTYSFLIRAKYYDSKRTLEETLNLQVESCASTSQEQSEIEETAQTEDEEKEEEQTTTPPSQTETKPTNVEIITKPTTSYIRPTAVATPKTSYTENGWWAENKWLIIIIATDVILVLAAILVITVIVRRRR